MLGIRHEIILNIKTKKPKKKNRNQHGIWKQTLEDKKYWDK